MSTGTYGKVQVRRGDIVEGRTETVEYEKRSDGWYIKVPGARKWQKFAAPQANERMVRQLIHKEFDSSFAVDPTPFGEFGGFSQ